MYFQAIRPVLSDQVTYKEAQLRIKFSRMMEPGYYTQALKCCAKCVWGQVNITCKMHPSVIVSHTK